MSTDPADVELVADAIVDARLQGHRDWTDRIARAVLAALDLDARDARVRAEALREHAARMREKAVNLPEHTGASWPWTGYLVAAKHAEYAADEIATASPSSSPVDAPSRPPRCPRCGSARWVSVSLDEGYTRRAQCVPCGAYHPGTIGPGWKSQAFTETAVDAPSRPTGTPGPDTDGESE